MSLNYGARKSRSRKAGRSAESRLVVAKERGRISPEWSCLASRDAADDFFWVLQAATEAERRDTRHGLAHRCSSEGFAEIFGAFASVWPAGTRFEHLRLVCKCEISKKLQVHDADRCDWGTVTLLCSTSQKKWLIVRDRMTASRPGGLRPVCMIRSALVIYLNENDAGLGFYRLASSSIDYGVLAKNAST